MDSARIPDTRSRYFFYDWKKENDKKNLNSYWKWPNTFCMNCFGYKNANLEHKRQITSSKFSNDVRF